MSLIQFIKDNVPLSLRIGKSFYTQMVVIGNSTYRKHNGIPCHLDKDMVTCIVNFGDVDNGGSTVFYNGKKPKKDCGELLHSVPFSHGRIQVGFFSEITHAVDAWEGNRMTLNLNFKKDVVQHFLEVGSIFYDEYEHHDFPPNDFVIRL